MTNQSPFLFLIPTLILALGCSTAQMASVQETDLSNNDTSLAELERLFRARQDSAKTVYVQADVDFMTGMIAHHAQALIMSGFAPDNEAGSQVQVLTSRIINAQKDEIVTMQNWLRDRDEPVPEIHIDGTMLMIHGVDEEHHHMPGMLSQEQLDELKAARGAEFDRLFLTYMIQHHKGAVTMVDVLFSTDGAALDDLAFKVGSDIQVDQLTEIARMERMLDRINESNQFP